MFKGVDFFPHGTKIPVMEWRRFCVSISLIATVLAIALLSTKGLNFGIDFKGGSLFEIQTKSGNVDIAELRSRLGELDL
ncbi:MAG: protein translocase subunit SecF, partial [Hyphomicrobiaceae bacterium]|nr:protein translocase subunit SecF [Hyphomicrobiaceae bacterium]